MVARRGVVPVLVIALVASTSRVGHADPPASAFVDSELGFGIASVGAFPGLCGSYAAPGGLLAMGRAGLGGGAFVSSNLAIVGRAHATDAIPSSHSVTFALFAGAGLQLRMATLDTSRDYVYVELVPGWETAATPEVANNTGLAIAARVGIYRSAWSVALASTVQTGAGSRDYSQIDLAFVVGLHL